MYKELDEQTLAKLCSEKDRQAQEELYTRYAARVFTLCLRYSDNRDEAQDLLHDSFLKVLEKIDTFKFLGKGSLLAWISRIAINTALANIRRYRLRLLFVDIFAAEDLLETTDEEIDNVPEEKLLELISQLPGTQRAIFNMYCIDGYSHKEIAKMLGISERGSTSMLAKAKSNLRKQITKFTKNSE